MVVWVAEPPKLKPPGAALAVVAVAVGVEPKLNPPGAALAVVAVAAGVEPKPNPAVPATGPPKPAKAGAELIAPTAGTPDAAVEAAVGGPNSDPTDAG